MSVSQQPDGKTCSNCGKPVRAATRFCGRCGMAVGSK
jgi:predicted amidophosphoribosyltransferase